MLTLRIFFSFIFISWRLITLLWELRKCRAGGRNIHHDTTRCCFPWPQRGPSGTGGDWSSSAHGPQVTEKEKELRGGVIWEGVVFLPWCLFVFSWMFYSKDRQKEEIRSCVYRLQALWGECWGSKEGRGKFSVGAVSSQGGHWEGLFPEGPLLGPESGAGVGQDEHPGDVPLLLWGNFLHPSARRAWTGKVALAWPQVLMVSAHPWSRLHSSAWPMA